MLFKFLNTVILLSFFCQIQAQKTVQSDSTAGKVLDEVIVTATRTENKVSNVPLPVSVITSKSIQLSGSQKLIDILQMQSGLVIATNPLGTALQGYPNPFGEGIQMQGLDPAYTLILVDGEPLMGRNAGIINLGRIATGNIRQVEIMKGPATSLYGSDALAGVINIITQEPKNTGINIQTHYATNNTLGLTGSARVKGNKSSLQLFANRYSSDGYDLDKTIYGKTVDPFIDLSLNAKWIYDFNPKNKLIISARYFSDKQFNNYLIYPEALPAVVKGTTVEKDQSIFTRYEHKLSNQLNYFTSIYVSGYSNNASVFLQKNDSLYEHIGLNQMLIKPELQVNMGKNPASLLVSGAGYNFESVNSTRYNSVKHLNSWYLFVQKQFKINDKSNLIAGARFDKNLLYPAQLSPKIAFSTKITPNLIFKGSIGSGFKAPDFRQQFLDFSNSLIGYTLLGARELGNGLETLRKNGQIDPNIDIKPYLKTQELVPEKSIGINAGFDYTLRAHTTFKINFFRNDISNLIETYNLPFNKLNNQSIFSYRNVNKVFTEGIEVSASHHFNRNLAIFGAYQYLVAKDKEVLQQIKDGKLYQRDPVTNVTSLVTKSDYVGLYNRSRNTGNARLQYTNLALNGSVFLTVKYRGNYGFSGLNGFQNGSGVYDDNRETVKGFALLNSTFSKRIGPLFELQAGIENILNYTNRLLMPNLYGRSYFINVNFKLEK
jgi:outer membrane receptor for ferrienterochelin and colicins